MPSLLMISPNHFTRWGGPRGARSRRIAAALARRGWRVRLAVVDGRGEPTGSKVEIAARVTGPPLDPSDRPTDGRRALRSRAVGALRRLAPYPDPYVRWSARTWLSLRNGEPAELVYVLAWPFSTIPAGAALARRFGAPLVVDLGDPWEHHGLATRALERASLPTAAAIVVTSAGTAKTYRERTSLPSDRIAVIPNGADLTAATPSGGRPPRFLSLGTISEARIDPAPGFLALAQLHREGRIEFDFYGATWLDLPADVLDRYRGVVPGEEAARLTRSADAVVILGNRDPNRVPSKVFEMARSDIPVLYLRGPAAESGARLLAETGHATVAPGADPGACRAAAEEVVARIDSGSRPRPTERYSWEETVDRIAELVHEVHSARGDRPASRFFEA